MDDDYSFCLSLFFLSSFLLFIFVKTGQNPSKPIKNHSLRYFALSQHGLYRQKQLFLRIGS